MKKLVLMAAVLFGAAMVSCGGGETTETVDSNAVETPEVVETVEAAAQEVVDSIAPDSVAEVIDAVVAQ